MIDKCLSRVRYYYVQTRRENKNVNRHPMRNIETKVEFNQGWGKAIQYKRGEGESADRAQGSWNSEDRRDDDGDGLWG